MKKDPREPSVGEFIEGIIDFFGSIPLVDVLQRKLEVRSYREFFNRAIGIGFILTGVGLFYVFVTLVRGSETNLVIFGQDMKGVAFLLALIIGLWLLSVLIREVNVGRGVDEYIGELFSDVFSRSRTSESSFRRMLLGEVITTIIYGLMLYWALSEIDLGTESVLETAHFFLVLAVFFGVILFMSGYVLRGLTGIVTLLRAEYGGRETAHSEEPPEGLDRVK